MKRRLVNDEKKRRKRPFGELLSAYLDDEVAAEKRWKVEKRLEQSPAAREALDRLARVDQALTSLPRAAAPGELVDNVMARVAREAVAPASVASRRTETRANTAEWVANAPTARSATRAHGGLTIGLMAASVAFAALSVWAIRGWAPDPAAEMARAPAALHETKRVADNRKVDLTPLPDPSEPFTEVGGEADGMDELRRILARDEELLAEELDEKQVTIATADVEGLLKQLETSLGRLALEESGSMPRTYVVELSGQAGQVSELLARLEKMGRTGELLKRVGIAKPTGEILAEIREEGAGGRSRAEIKVVQARISDHQAARNGAERTPSTDTVGNGGPKRNQALVRPIRVLLVVKPDRRGGD